MTKEELQRHKMLSEEQKIWDEIKARIRVYCKGIIPEEFTELIEKHIAEAVYYQSYAGYCSGEGYYYINIGDRGEIDLACKTESEEEMLFYLMKKILRDVGIRLELRQRDKEQEKWMYYLDDKNTRPGKLAWVKNERYIYHTKHDTRKWWFEYILRNLQLYFGKERLVPLIEEYTQLLNRRFHAPHWGYDREKLQFVEISDSVEK